MYPIHDKCLDQFLLTLSGLHFIFRRVSSYSSSTLRCRDIWKVNEIVSLTPLPDLQREPAVLVLGRYCPLTNCTPWNIMLVAPTAELGFHWQNDLNAVACRGLCSGFTVTSCGQEFSGCLRLKWRWWHWLSIGFGREVAKWLQEGGADLPVCPLIFFGEAVFQFTAFLGGLTYQLDVIDSNRGAVAVNVKFLLVGHEMTPPGTVTEWRDRYRVSCTRAEGLINRGGWLYLLH